jgi:AraC-like DNA-binding protein
MEVGAGLLPGPVPLGRVAPLVGVSPSMLGRQFTDHVGVPWRQWVLARRLQAAARVVANGATLTTAAHAAGFSDSAHLTRTFRRMFGIAPSEVAAGARWHVH